MCGIVNSWNKLAPVTLALAVVVVAASAAADTPSSKPALAPPVPSDVAGKPQGRLAIGEPAPEIIATTLDGRQVSLAGLRAPRDEAGPPRLIVLQFGSMTEPVFRSRVPAVEKLAAKYPQRVHFVIVYGTEAHASDSPNALEINEKDGFGLAEPATIAERQKAAQGLADRLKIKNQTVLVDAWNNTSALRYGSYPNMTFIIDDKGVLQAGYPWMDPNKVARTLDALLADKPLPPELRGSVKPSAPAPLDVTGSAMDMAGRGPAVVALALDRSSMTEAQRQKLLPALGRYFADLQKFRETRIAMNGNPARGNRGNAQSTDAEKAPRTPEDAQNALTQLRKSADDLKTLIKETLNEKDADALLSALEQTQAQRLFAK
jgi:hypothetical protein